jgi:hypothetical protein
MQPAAGEGSAVGRGSCRGGSPEGLTFYIDSASNVTGLLTKLENDQGQDWGCIIIYDLAIPSVRRQSRWHQQHLRQIDDIDNM